MRRTAQVTLGLVSLVLMASACRSLSVEIGVVEPTPTAVAAATAVPPVREIALASDATTAPGATAVVATATPPTSTGRFETTIATTSTVATQPRAAPTATQVIEPTAPSTPTASAAPAVPVLQTVIPSGPSFAPHGTRGSASGVFTNSEQRDRYAFDGEQGQLLEVRVKRTSGTTLTTQIALLDPSGVNELPYSFPTLPENFVDLRLASTGGYTIVVSPFQGSGSYTVTWYLDRFGQLANGGEVDAEISDQGQMDRYHFEGRQDQLLTARVQRTSGVSLQPWIELIDATGTSEKYVDGFGQAHVTLEEKLASSGTYTLAVGGRNTGPYAVTIMLR